MNSFLDRMAASSRERASAARRLESHAALARRAQEQPAPLTLRLNGFDLIAELKLRSPAAGGLAAPGFDAGRQLDAYADGGAAAVSVLTEPDEFHGDLSHLRSAAERLRARACPVMRKDFLVDGYQVIEARAHGASGVLLIAAMLDDGELAEMTAAAVDLGMFVLLEAFDTGDLDRLARLPLPGTSAGGSAEASAAARATTDASAAASAAARAQILIGVNSRNLKTLDVDFARFAALAGQVRRDVPAVAESGIDSADDIQTVARAGYALALVGSALMRDGEPERGVARLLTAGRQAIAGGEGCS